MEENSICSVDQCSRVIYNKTHQLCNAHYLRLKRTGNPLGLKGAPVRQVGFQGICTNEGCDREVTQKTLLLCKRCYQQWRIHENVNGRRCSVDGCNNPHNSNGYCTAHNHRLRRYGDPLAGEGRGVKGKRRGILKLTGEHITSGGYKKIRVEDGDKKVRWVLEHRYIMEQILGRPLRSDENVHHKDGNKLNNDIENLELWIKPQPCGVRVEDAVASLWIIMSFPPYVLCIVHAHRLSMCPGSRWLRTLRQTKIALSVALPSIPTRISSFSEAEVPECWCSEAPDCPYT
jgi:HNH endonuclease